jgi:hypothetical protein
MAEIKLIETFDDSNVFRQLDNLENQLTAIGIAGEQAGQSLASGLQQGAKAADNLDNQLGKTADEIKRHNAAVAEGTKALTGWRAKLKETIDSIQIGGKSVAEWKGQLNETKDVLKSVTASGEGTSRMIKILNTVMKANVFALLITAVAGLIAYFTKFQAGIDLVNKALAGVGATVDVVVKRFAQFGQGLVSIVTGNFSKGFDEIKGSVAGMATEISNAASAAFDLEAQFQALRDQQIAYQAVLAKQTLAVERLKEIGKDETLSYKERLKALREAGSIEVGLSEKRIEMARKNRDLVQQQNQILSDNVERRQALADAEVELIEAEAEADKTRREINKEIRGIYKDMREERKAAQEEERKQVEQMRKEYDSLIKSLITTNQQLSLEAENNPITKIQREWDKAISEAQKMRHELYRLAPTPEDAEFVDQQISELMGRLTKKYKEELDATAAELEAAKQEKMVPAISPLPQPDYFRSAARFQVSQYDKITNEEIIPALEALLTEIAEAFNLRGRDVIDVNEAKALFDGVKSAFADAYEGYTTLQEVQIEISQQKVDQLQAEIDKQAEKIQLEKQRFDDGLANELAAEQRKSQELIALRNKEQKKILDAQKKAAQQELIIEGVQQASSLTTAAANVLQAESNKGLLGIGLAFGAIALIFKLFAQAKANSLKFSQPTQLRKGAKLQGKSHEEGGIPLIVSGERYYEAERGEWLIGTKPSQVHDQFLERLNAGKYNNVDLIKKVEGTGHHVSDTASRTMHVVSRLKHEDKNPIVTALEIQTKNISGQKKLVTYKRKH